MEELYNLGLSDNTIKTMLEITPEIKEMNENEVREKLLLLKKINCTNTQIVNIASSNSNYLIRTNSEIINLINSLLKYGFDNLNILFDSNPYILNLDPFEIDNYINDRKNNGEDLEKIINDLDSNPYLFDEL